MAAYLQSLFRRLGCAIDDTHANDLRHRIAFYRRHLADGFNADIAARHLRSMDDERVRLRRAARRRNSLSSAKARVWLIPFGAYSQRPRLGKMADGVGSGVFADSFRYPNAFRI